MSRLPCLHCKVRDGNSSRGLCSRCYYTPGVRELYPKRKAGARDVYTRRGAGTANKKRPLPTPTATLPGTPERLAVLVARAAAEEALWHPDDAIDELEVAAAAFGRTQHGSTYTVHSPTV